MITPTSSGINFPFHPAVPFATSPVGTTSPPAVPLLAPGEVIKPSGKYALPTKVPGKSYLKNEVVIRNADSGKGKYISYIIIALVFKPIYSIILI
jgi:hypothetical protein